MQHVAHVHRPAVAYPRHVMSTADMVALAEREYGRSPDIERIKAMIGNTQIAERSFAVAPQQLERGTGLAARAALYLEHALPLACEVSRAALDHAALRAEEIDAIILASCTGFVMPSLDAYLMNRIGLPRTIKRMPLAQLGCVAGASALLKASDHCRAFPHARVLVVCVELSSLCFHPEFDDLSSAVCASIFGDGAAACVVTGAGRGATAGLQLGANLTYTEPASEHYIRYAITDRGYHLTLDRAVMHIVPRLVPMLVELLAEQGIGRDELEFVLAHTGGRRILDLLGRALAVAPALLEPSRASLRERGNTASVSILDVIARTYAGDARPGEPAPTSGRKGMLVAFGPGFTMEAAAARWL
jgi:predicted naringenin-chalcone synthase